MFTLDEGGYFSLLAHIPLVLSNAISAVVDHHNGSLIKREEEIPRSRFITFAVLIPILVLLSGLFAGLTLGYMSLDETQLNVLSLSGTPYVKSLTSSQPISYTTAGNREYMPNKSSRSERMGTCCW